MRSLPLLLLLAATVLSGCSGGSGDKESGNETDVEGQPQLHGYVFDPAIKPLAGATVRVLENNASAVTDEDGFYGLAGLPTDQFVVLVVTMDGYSTMSQQITLAPKTAVILNFTLTPIPVAVPYMNVLSKLDLFLACQTTTDVSGQNSTTDCSGGQGQRDRWDFAIDRELAGAVIEIFWDPIQPGADSLAARLETLELGKFNTVLGEAIGTSPLVIAISQDAAEKYYAAGGLASLKVWVAPNIDENEVGAGAGVAIQQDMEVYASLFYIEPPSPTYTIQDP